MPEGFWGGKPARKMWGNWSQFENSVKAREATPENVSGQSNRAGVKIEKVNFLAKEKFFD